LRNDWQRVEVTNKPAMVYDVPDVVRPLGAVVFLHDIDEVMLDRKPSFTGLLKQYRLACICPCGDSTWWLDRPWPTFDVQTTAERWLVHDVVPYVQSRWSLAAGRVGLLGLGMGGQGALRLAFRHPKLFSTVVGLDSILDFHDLYHEGTALDEMYESKERCRQDTAILQIHPAQFPPHVFFACDPTNGRWLRGNDRLHEKLGALGIGHEVDFATSVGGDSWAYAERMAERSVEFLGRGIAEESRRLL